ncbi:hypothetical protein AYO42_02495 [Rhizomicrobium sp. SCGC AG-212-E05]|nr:hypothetical protein AYO42_02495 [Rhizomicrobium sp. SCGC AG-212-E05]
MRLVPKFLLGACGALAFGAVATQAQAEVHQTGSVNVPADRYADVSWTRFEGPVNRLRFYAVNDTINCEHISVTYRDGTTHEVFRGSIPLGGFTTVTFPEGDSRMREVAFACKASLRDGARITFTALSEGQTFAERELPLTRRADAVAAPN